RFSMEALHSVGLRELDIYHLFLSEDVFICRSPPTTQKAAHAYIGYSPFPSNYSTLPREPQS
ncbi:hypothetical protein J6590_063003, partial [Homalodisca vitripennis]